MAKKEIRPYKVMHKPSGLFYQPHKFRGSNLSERGKIYQTSTNGLSDARKRSSSKFIVYVEENSRVHKILKDMLDWKECSWQHGQLHAETNTEDWVNVEI